MPPSNPGPITHSHSQDSATKSTQPQPELATGAQLPGHGIEELRRSARVFITNYRAAERYQPRRLNCNACLFHAEGSSAEPQHGSWSKWIEPISQHGVPGDHKGMLRPPHVEVLAQLLGQQLDQLQKGAFA